MRCRKGVGGFRGLTTLVVLAVVAPSMDVVADVPDQFEGVIWRFEMKSRKHPDLKFGGFFRVSEQVLYQAETPGDKQLSKKVGENHPIGGKTRFDVHDFRVFRPENRGVFQIKGTARLGLVKIGEWEGMFTEGTGANWDFHAYRVQE